MLNILERVEAPKQLIKIAMELFEDVNVELIIFDKYHPNPQHADKVGCFVPTLNAIIIYLGACLETATKIMAKGMTYHAAVWYEMLYALYHEGAHAAQLQAGAEHITPYLEEEASRMARLAIAENAHDFDDMVPPKIEEMGWAGGQLFELLNNMLIKNPQFVREMLACNGQDVGGYPNMLLEKPLGNELLPEWLKTAEAEGDAKRINGTLYLTFNRAIGAL